MSVILKPAARAPLADKRALRKLIAEQNAQIGLVKDPAATAEQAREMILADGVRPDENVFSRGIIAAREE